MAESPRDGRLDSWKEIAAYLKRDITTVQRWEKRERLPVHRHVHERRGSVYAYETELDQWLIGRGPQVSVSGRGWGKTIAIALPLAALAVAAVMYVFHRSGVVDERGTPAAALAVLPF